MVINVKDLKQLIEDIIDNQEEENKEKDYQEYLRFIEMSAYENELKNQKIDYIAGVDEVGRGPLAGPVVAACVILPEHFYLPGLNDSKKISKKNHRLYYEYIIEHAVSYGIGVASVEEIDCHNIYQCSKLAMKRAVEQLNLKPQHLLIDAMTIEVDIPQTSIIKGDAKSISIAAASIVAKVTRDEYMKRVHDLHPLYNFKQNAGYGTKEHLEAIDQYGIIGEHRKSFEPIKSKISTKTTLFDI